MLKIKDFVDLKELEKFGWKKSKNPDAWYSLRNKNSKIQFVGIEKETRIISYDRTPFSDDEVEEFGNCIFELTKLGLVEKVEG